MSNEICDLCNVLNDNFHTVANCKTINSLSRYLASKNVVLAFSTVNYERWENWSSLPLYCGVQMSNVYTLIIRGLDEHCYNRI